MAGRVTTERMLDGYFGLLRKLDTEAKKRLIIRLTESIGTDKVKPLDIGALFGAWTDSRDSDEIIRDIREAPTPNRETGLWS